MILAEGKFPAENYYLSLRYAIEQHLTYKHGLILEFGVMGGGSTEMIKRLCPEYKICGFDTFEGLPTDWIMPNGDVLVPKGTFDCGGRIPEIEGVEFYKGLFSDTLPVFLSEFGERPIDLLHLDCDLYESTKDVLWELHNCIVSGTLIVFDEWTYAGYGDHEQKAFLEWCEEFNRSWEHITFTDTVCPGRFILRIL